MKVTKFSEYLREEMEESKSGKETIKRLKDPKQIVQNVKVS